MLRTTQDRRNFVRRITSREFQGNFGLHQDKALKGPLVITRNGRDRLVLLSTEEYTRLKRRDQRAIAVENLSDADIEAILLAEPPAEAAQYDHEWTAEHSANS